MSGLPRNLQDTGAGEESLAVLTRELILLADLHQLELMRALQQHQGLVEQLLPQRGEQSPPVLSSRGSEDYLEDQPPPPMSPRRLEIPERAEISEAIAPRCPTDSAPVTSSSDSPVATKKTIRSSTAGVLRGKSKNQMDVESQDTTFVDTFAGAAVLLNALVMAFELECQGHQVGEQVGIPDSMGCTDVDPLFKILEHVFTLTFALELIWRLARFRWSYFNECFNIFDALLVSLGCLDLYVLSPLASGNLGLMRVLRVIKLARMGTWMWLHYGTAYRAALTMYYMTFAGNWPVYARPVLENVSHAFVIFYLAYITLIVFAVIRVITAIFLSQTLEAASSDAEMIIQERLRKKAAFIRKLESVFNAMDESGDGVLSEDEMSELLRDPKVQAYLESLEVAVPESEALFRLLANGDGLVTYDDFIEGILRCKGPARAMDQIVLQADVKALSVALSNLARALEDAKLLKVGAARQCRRNSRTKSRFVDELTLMQASSWLSGSHGNRT
ncbi:unnamed protein product [Effrenium voratum]|nr:unnamed protein product [Effrenium voratum]